MDGENSGVQQKAQEQEAAQGQQQQEASSGQQEIGGTDWEALLEFMSKSLRLSSK